MGTNRTPLALTKALHLGLFATLFFCAMFAGCENFCVVVVSNPGGGGGVAGAGTNCTVPQQTGNVTLRLGSSFTPATSSGPSDVQHIFVSLRGIEALPIDATDGNSAAWQELVPEIVVEPAQVDLIARVEDSCGPSTFPGTVVNAGVYSRVRLRLVPNQPKAGEPVPSENACGGIGFNCVVTTNGSVRPLASDDQTELRIPADDIAGGFFRVLPDDHIRLAIDFEPRTSIILPADDGGRLISTFSVTQRPSCGSGQ
jgi:hypothetical protein